MSKKTFSNLMSKEKQRFLSSAAKYKKLDQFALKIESPSQEGNRESRDYDTEDSDSDVSDAFDLEFGDAIGEIPEKCVVLKAWAVRNNISQNAVNDLLQNFPLMGINGFPKSAKSLLPTKRHNFEIQHFSEGDFVYFGIQNHFSANDLSFLVKASEVLIDVGIDGLKLYKCADKVLWPILGSLVGFPELSPFLIACFSGTAKPKSIDEFMRSFCEEVASLRENGLKIGNTEYVKKFDIRLFTCDTPARAYVTGVKGHTSLNGCSKCCQVGESVERRVTYSKTLHTPRSDSSFSLRTDKAHHSLQYQNSKSLMELYGFGMVSQLPLDAMHLVDLGVMKKILNCLIKVGNLPKMEEKMNLIKRTVPKEFGRTSRNLKEISHWKATEFRQFLLYSGIFVLKDCIPKDYYDHFLLLHSGIRLLSCERSFREKGNKAQELLENFVDLFGLFYENFLLTFNVHGLLHLSECAMQFGPLDSFSAYKFENYMQQLKKMIRKPNTILEQLCLRLQERSLLNSSIVHNSLFGKELIIDFTHDKDSYYFSETFGPLKIIGKDSDSKNDVYLARIFLEVEDYFYEPVRSSSALDIVVSSHLDTNSVVKIPKDMESQNIFEVYDEVIIERADLPTEEVIAQQDIMPSTSTPISRIENFRSTPLKKRKLSKPSTDVTAMIQEVIDAQNRIENKIDELKNDMVHKANFLATSKMLREVKVTVKLLKNSVATITGENPDELLTEIAALLPLNSIAALHDLEEKLKKEEYEKPMTAILYKLKGVDESVVATMKKIFTDELMDHFNYDGRNQKRALDQLLLVDKFMSDVFKMHGRSRFENLVRKAVMLSHNRTKQKRYLNKSKSSTSKSTKRQMEK